MNMRGKMVHGWKILGVIIFCKAADYRHCSICVENIWQIKVCFYLHNIQTQNIAERSIKSANYFCRKENKQIVP